MQTHRLALLVSFCLISPAAALGPPSPPLTVQPDHFVLSGLQDGRQLLVSWRGPDGRPRDCSRQVSFSAQPAGIVSISPGGYVRVRGKGEATITATVEIGGTDWQSVLPRPDKR